jgi:MoaA/NifB/PqqE/SkfB family radical SAM enzyme
MNVGREIRKMLGLRYRPFIVQIELAGKCSANCEFCDWTRRPKEQMIFLETALAKKAVEESRQMKADLITFHITGESLDHPDFFDIVPHDYNVGLSTNCLSLDGETAWMISEMDNMNITLAILWAESDTKRLKSITNALHFLEMHPKCKTIQLQMICSERSVPYAREMYSLFSPFCNDLPQMKLFYKQPYTQESNIPILGYIPTGIIESSRVVIDKMPTPQSCGMDCLAISPNPVTSIIVQSDGEIKPCFYRPNDPLRKEAVPKGLQDGWQMGNIKNMSLQEFWASGKLKQMRAIWATGDPDKKLPCHDCIRMVTPRGDPVWFNTTNIPPTVLDIYQSKKGDPADPYPKPDN